MADRIENLKINYFRGIKDLEISNCNDINIIMGDNNSGKTSIIEAINVLKNDSIYNLLDILKYRNQRRSVQYFSYLFPIDGNSISVKAKLRDSNVDVNISTQKTKIIFDKDVFLSDVSENVKDIFSSLIDIEKHNGKEEERVTGTINYNGEVSDYSFISYDVSMGKISKTKEDNLKVFTITPFDHFMNPSNNIPSVLKDDGYHKMLIEVLKIFDESIEDILSIADEESSNYYPITYIKKKDMDPLPISIYGDGLKKVVLLAIAIVKATDGILLIDELETSLHNQYYDDVFTFLIRTARAFNVQLFVTTHNKEVIEYLLSIGEKYKKNADFINTYTIRKKIDKSYAYMMTGKKAYESVMILNREVRL